MRVVLEGTQGSPLTVVPADIPSTADESYFRRCVFQGTFTHRLRFADFVQCRIEGDLSGADLSGFDSWDSDWLGPLPSDIRMDGRHDLVVAMFKRRLSIVSGQEAVLIQAIITYLNNGLHDGDWPDGMHHLRSLGFTGQQVKNMLKDAFAGRPTFLQHILDFDNEVDWSPVRNRLSDAELEVRQANDTSFYILAENFTPDMKDELRRRDRFALARRSEEMLDALYPVNSWRCRWRRILPSDARAQPV